MVQFILEIDNASVNAVVNSFAAQHRYKTQVPNPEFDLDPDNNPRFIDNPESKEDFLVRKLSEFVEQSVVAFNARSAAKEARDTAKRNTSVNIGRSRQ